MKHIDILSKYVMGVGTRIINAWLLGVQILMTLSYNLFAVKR